MKYNNILLFTIPSTLHTGHFNQYFIENSNNLYLYIIPLSTQKPEVKLIHYQNGIKKTEKILFWYKGSNIFVRYIFLYIYYVLIILTILPRRTLIFSTNPLFCLMSNVFNIIKSIKVVYHIGDYYHNPKGIMQLFNYLTRYYNKHLRYVVYCSPVIEKMYRLNNIKKDGNRNYWVFGIKKISVIKTIEPNLLGYIGVLRPGQGLDLVFEALSQNNKLKLEIMGDGPLLPILKNEVRRKKLVNRVKFLGLINDEKQIISIVSRWQIGLAPYNPSIYNMTLYTEPSKIKFYLEYKLPVIMTKITYIHKEIEKYKAGVTIEYSTKSLIDAISTIQKNYHSYLIGVAKFIKLYEYNRLYDKQFKFFRTIF